MFDGYKSSSDEQVLTKCDKCDCFVLSDSFEKPLRPRKFKSKNPYHVSSESNSNEAVILDSQCHSTVKIIVQSIPGEDLCTCKSTDSNNSAGAKRKSSKKNICLRLCRKKDKQAEKEETKNKPKQSKKEQNDKEDPKAGNAAVAPNMPASDVDVQSGFTGLDAVKHCNACGKTGGGCNTNTIIFPRDKFGGDGVANLENFIRTEARISNRNLEDILSEVQKQRREIQELKEMLDVVVRALRDQLFMTTFPKGKAELNMFEDLCRKNWYCYSYQWESVLTVFF
ncbi:hypothetical protein GEV33_005320 [Tenebrio molitor]|jgi:hypothetical protein|uniref:Uncharacterized protein n=1 Tax=Tenebrio molitor TaxID=7067 RepID=A0A8J6HN56_TENMO|nr:hypothetical protein GEV33_005320 [Tenebrio molitor]